MTQKDNNTYTKMLCLLNHEYFIKDVLGYSVESHHQDILRHIQDNRTTLILSPRGFGKSSIISIAYCLWKVACNRNIRILIVSSTATQGASFLREIRYHLEHNQRLKDVFGSFVPDKAKWTEYELTVSNRTTSSKESTISTAGSNGSVTGRHWDLIVADDVTDFESSRTQVQREKLSQWYRTSLLPSLEPSGQLIAIGTRYHPLDLYEELINSGKYSVLIQRAIDDNGLSLWPAKFSIDDLQKRKDELGSLIFDLQYNNSTLLMRSSNIFKFEHMQFYDTVPAGLRVYSGCDLAISTKSSSDYFVMVTIGIDKKAGNIYILDVYMNRLSFSQQIDLIKAKAAQFNPLIIGIESNAFQAALSGELIRTSTLPILKINTIVDKVTRAMKRSPLFESGKILLRKDMNVLIDQLCLFPNAAHDDVFDGLDMALTAYEKSSIQQPQQFHFTKSIGRPGVRC